MAALRSHYKNNLAIGGSGWDDAGSGYNGFDIQSDTDVDFAFRARTLSFGRRTRS